MTRPRDGDTGRAASLSALIFLGAVAGLLSGLFGVGGGILIVPALVLLLGFSQRIAHATSLAAVVPISTVGALTYAVKGDVDIRIALVLTAGTVLGTTVGVHLLSWLSERLLKWAFIAFMIFVAARMFFDVTSRSGSYSLDVAAVAVLVALGLITGVLSGLLGVGGGVFLVPVMVVFLGISDLTAKGVSLLVIIPTGIVATVLNVRRGNVNLRAAGAIGVVGALTSIGGASLSFLLAPRAASILFAAFLLLVSIRMSIQTVKMGKKPAPDAAARVQDSADPSPEEGREESAAGAVSGSDHDDGPREGRSPSP